MAQWGGGDKYGIAQKHHALRVCIHTLIYNLESYSTMAHLLLGNLLQMLQALSDGTRRGDARVALALLYLFTRTHASTVYTYIYEVNTHDTCCLYLCV
jgi:hypothetical protein